MTDVDILVIGAGPTGLGAAWWLDSHGHDDWLLLEQQPVVGGLSRSFVDDAGYTWDVGGHVCFSHYDTFNNAVGATLGAQNCYEHNREAWVRHEQAWVPYPFQNNLHRLEPETRERCLAGLSEAARMQTGGAATPSNFLEFIHATFGAGIAKEFMVPYNQKVWAHPLGAMSYRWIGERVSVPDPERARRAIQGGEDDVAWGPNNRFLFPKSGGTGAFWSSIAQALPARHVRTSACVERIDAERRVAYTRGGDRVGYNTLVTTTPLSVTARMLGDAGLVASTSELSHNSVHIVGVGVDPEVSQELGTWCWMYFPSARSPFYRVTNFSHYSPAHTPDGSGSLMVEVAESAHLPRDARTIVDDVVRGLIAEGLLGSAQQVRHTWTHKAEYGYPVPTLSRDTIVKDALSALEARGIYSRGRFGAWRYEVGNMDHSFMQGYEVAARTVEGTTEVTLWNAERVNRNVATRWPARR